jgi:hypothetical protein
VNPKGLKYEVCVDMDLSVKIAAFCRELGDTTLREMAQENEETEKAYGRAEKALKDGQPSPGLEADLDLLNAMVEKREGQGLYPVTRAYQPWPDPGRGTGAQWWTCPRDRCAGRGRVKPGQAPPLCGATGEQLVPGPLPV